MDAIARPDGADSSRAVPHAGGMGGGGSPAGQRYSHVDESGNATPNPLYQQPLAYQPPMAVRLGMQVGS